MVPQETWVGITSAHPWTVRIVKVGTTSVVFEVKRGPGKSRKKVQRMALEGFLACYRRCGGAR